MRKVATLALILIVPLLFLSGVVISAKTASGLTGSEGLSKPSEKVTGPSSSVHGTDEAWRQPIIVAKTTNRGMGDSPVSVITPSTTLTVAILSAPWATLDSNDPAGQNGVVPSVFLVQAVITNSGSVTATNVMARLDYNEDTKNNWLLLPGESAERWFAEMAPGANSVIYWFTTYSSTIGTSHRYTVTAVADNAVQVSTANNANGNPVPGATFQTRSSLSTGSSGLTQYSLDVIVGAAFTVSVGYDLGTAPENVALNPVGNLDFNPAAFRLLSSELILSNDAGSQVQIIKDRTYLPSLPPFAENVTATYTFVAFTLDDIFICPHTAVGYHQNIKYDQGYCADTSSSVISIKGSSALSVTSIASDQTIRQDERLTYTVHYTNQGNESIANVWIWDEIDASLGSIITTSIDPPGEPVQTTGSRIAWFINDISPAGQMGSSGTLTFSILVDGNGVDLIDGIPVVNHTFYGIGPFGFPQQAAMTTTVSSVIQAPVLSISKSDDRASVNAGLGLIYTLRLTNSGSITATNLVITDVLPAGLTYVSGSAGETRRTGQRLIWDDRGSVGPHGGSVVITIPTRTDGGLTAETTLTNTMIVGYGNGAGHLYSQAKVSDTTIVKPPIFSIDIRSFPDPVVAGDLLTYTIIYSNTTAKLLTDVILSSPIPMNTTFQYCLYGAYCVISDGIIGWGAGGVAAFGSGRVGFVVRVSDTLPNGSVLPINGCGVQSDQSGMITGIQLSTTVIREAGWFQGHAYIDTDADGVYDAGESPLAGITTTLTSATVPVVNTDAAGAYRFRVETEGQVSLSADVLYGYTRTTSGDVTLNSVYGITQTVDFGYAPLACLPDDHEPDDAPAQAIMLERDSAQSHNFCNDDIDWQKFEATTGFVYSITATALGTLADPILTLYGPNMQMISASKSNLGAVSADTAHIIWQAIDSGIYYVRVENQAGTGADTEYDLQLQAQTPYLLYLPIIFGP